VLPIEVAIEAPRLIILDKGVILGFY